MKKCIWLMVLVLGMSTTAWSACHVGVNVLGPVCAGDDSLDVSLDISCSGQWTTEGRPVVSQFGNLITMDFYWTCTDLSGSTCEEDSGTLALPQPLCSGLYIVVVRIWGTYECWPFCALDQPLFCGLGSTYFTAYCSECDCFPCYCWMYACPANDG